MIVLTLGTFDLFHEGHVRLLRRCAELAHGGSVVVGLNTDEFVARYKGQPPVIPYAGREAVLLGCRYVDRVVANDQPDGSALALIGQVAPDFIAVGSDWMRPEYLAQLGITWSDLEPDFAHNQIGLVFLPYTPGEAGPSSAIKQRVRERP